MPLMTGAAAEPDRISYAALGVPLFPDDSIQSAVSDGAWTYARNASPPEEAKAIEKTAEADGAAAEGNKQPEPYEGRAVAPGAEFLFDRTVDPVAGPFILRPASKLASRVGANWRRDEARTIF
jgi:hypothetical protein